MLTCVHVGYLGLLKALAKFSPGLILDIVRLTNIEAPNVALRILQHAKQTDDMIS